MLKSELLLEAEIMEEINDKAIKMKLAELAEQQGLEPRNEWPIWKKECNTHSEIARVDHVWLYGLKVKVGDHEETWRLPVVAFEIIRVRDLRDLSQIKKDLENLRLSGAALGVIVVQAFSEDDLKQYMPEHLIKERPGILATLAFPVRIGIAYAGDIMRGELCIKWLSDISSGYPSDRVYIE